MNKVEKAAERTVRRGRDDPPVLPEESWKRGECIRRDVSGMSEISGLCKTAEPEMSLHGTENILRKLQSTLLQAGNAGKDPRRYAVFGTEDAAVSSDFSYLAFDLQHEREAKSKSIKERYL